MTAFKRSQAKYVKGTYKATNWPEYEAGLRQRGSLTAWIAEDELKGWGPPKHGRRKPGGQVQYSNHAIEIALTVGMVFHLRLRRTAGFLRSLFTLLVLDGRVPDNTTISRRAKKLGKLPICAPAGNRPVHILIDSTGLSIHVGNLRKRHDGLASRCHRQLFTQNSGLDGWGEAEPDEHLLRAQSSSRESV